MNPSRIAAWLRGWARAAFTLDARSLAAYRIALGGLLCADCLLRMRDFNLMLAVDGIFPPATVRGFHGDPTRWSLSLVLDATWWNALGLALEGVAGAALAAGVATRVATIAAWVAVVSLVRRAPLASNAGDSWLACQLFWSMFLPLGAAWSWDARRRAAAGGRIGPAAFASVATAALVLQLVAVYVSAGLVKCNATWTSGEAIAHALSVHDHGTPLGTALARTGLVAGPLAWGVVALEIAVPLLVVAWPTPRMRGVALCLFVAFHAIIWLTMSVGLFTPIAVAAWLPLVPAAVWDRGRSSTERSWDRPVGGLSRSAAWVCGGALVLAAASLVRARTGTVPLPRPVAAAVNLAALDQDWAMFGRVPPVEQWVRARAMRADGVEIDLLRGGRPCESGPPAGGFTSLPHHRWHKLCWMLPLPGMRGVAAEVAAGLARRWNATHGPAERVRSVEIRHGSRGTVDPESGEFDRLVASWPPRDAVGGGNLDRLLDAADAAGE